MVILAVHGGAGGDGEWKGMSEADPFRMKCMHDLLSDIGQRLSEGSLDALEAVTLAVEAMEDEPFFNAGRGSVLDEEGNVTMDASVMRGHDRAAGAVIGVTSSRHPIRIANAILQRGWPLILAGRPAEQFGIENGVEDVGAAWLTTELRKAQWKKWRSEHLRPGATDEEDAILDHDGESDGWGTVGAIAMDATGKLAAATSTGGMTGKPVGRVGDSPIIGAGTWADDDVAVSCTGVGEAFIRSVASYRIAELHHSMNLEHATAKVLGEVAGFGGRGGLIALSTSGELVMPFQTMLMYRGYYRDGDIRLGIGPEMFEQHE